MFGSSSVWHPGPMPPNTGGWGAVVPIGQPTASGFYLCAFHGDRVILAHDNTVLLAHEIGWWTNPIKGGPGS